MPVAINIFLRKTCIGDKVHGFLHGFLRFFKSPAVNLVALNFKPKGLILTKSFHIFSLLSYDICLEKLQNITTEIHIRLMLILNFWDSENFSVIYSVHNCTTLWINSLGMISSFHMGHIMVTVQMILKNTVKNLTYSSSSAPE